MKYKIIIPILIMTLMITGPFSIVFGNVSATEEDTPYPAGWEDMTAEEIARYVEGLLEENPWDKIDNPDSPNLQDPVNSGGPPYIYEPPWDYYEDGNETAGGGIGFAWVETGADEDKGFVHTITESGPGVGGHSALGWIAHGFWFQSTAQATYEFTFEYDIHGWAVGFSVDSVTPPGSGFSGVQVYLIFQVKTTEETVVLVNEQTIPFVHATYDVRLDETVTHTMQVPFLASESSRISVIAVAKSTTSGVGVGAAGAEGYLDDLSNPGVGGVLKKVTVTGPDFEMKEIWMSSQPDDGDKNYEVPNPSPGQSVYFHYRYKLHGSGAYPPYRREVRLNGDVFCSRDAVTTANEGGHTYYVWCNDPWVAVKGTHVIESEVDVNNEINELDENNNEINYEFRVGEDLYAHGSLGWPRVKPGSTVTGSFEVENVGSPGSELDWEITEWPSWGNWTFDPLSGDNLKPEDGAITVQVSVVAPNEESRKFEGEIKIENTKDPSDCNYIDVILMTPKNKKSMVSFQLHHVPHLTDY